MPGQDYFLTPEKAGNELSAAKQNVVYDLLKREITGAETLVNLHGTHIAKSPEHDWFWCRLNKPFSGDPSGESGDPPEANSVSIHEIRYINGDWIWQDSGYNYPKVYPSITMIEDALDTYGPGHPGRAVLNPRDDRYYFFPIYETWRFELYEDLTQWTNVPVQACKRNWDPEGNVQSGDAKGLFVINLSLKFEVYDARKVGYFGYEGAEGAAEIRYAGTDFETDDYQIIGIICDLECPPECPCGTVPDPSATFECS